MIVFAMLLAGAAIEPLKAIGDASSWLSDDDYPALARQQGEEGRVLFRLLISPAGKVDLCEILESSGSAQLDQQTCALMFVRAKFKPARDEQGKAIYATVTRSSLWHLTKKIPYQKPPADIEISVSALPTGVSNPLLTNVWAIIDETGAIRACQPRASQIAPAVKAIACQQVHANWKPRPAINSQGHPVSTLQSVSVKFLAPELTQPATKN